MAFEMALVFKKATFPAKEIENRKTNVVIMRIKDISKRSIEKIKIKLSSNIKFGDNREGEMTPGT